MKLQRSDVFSKMDERGLQNLSGIELLCVADLSDKVGFNDITLIPIEFKSDTIDRLNECLTEAQIEFKV